MCNQTCEMGKTFYGYFKLDRITNCFDFSLNISKWDDKMKFRLQPFRFECGPICPFSPSRKLASDEGMQNSNHRLAPNCHDLQTYCWLWHLTPILSPSLHFLCDNNIKVQRLWLAEKRNPKKHPDLHSWAAGQGPGQADIYPGHLQKRRHLWGNIHWNEETGWVMQFLSKRLPAVKKKLRNFSNYSVL